MTRLTITIAALLIAAAPLAAEDVAITGAVILTGDGKSIAGGAVLLRDGKILRVTDGAVPGGFKRVDYKGATIIPGLVAASTQATISGKSNEESSEVTPTFTIAGTLDPTSRDNRRCLQQGITTAYVRPGLSNVIGGFGAVIRPGATGEQFLVRKKTELLIPAGPWPSSGNWSPGWGGVNNPKARRPSTRLATIWLIRKSFHDARRFMKTGSIEGLEKETPGPYTREELETLADALRGKITVRFYAQADKDVRTVFRLVDELGIKRFMIEGLVEAYRGPRRLARLDAGLIAEVHDLDPMTAGQELGLPMPVHHLLSWIKTGHDHHELCQFCPSCASAGLAKPKFQPAYGYRANNFSVLSGRNAKVALSTGERIPTLLEGATLAVRHGLKPEQALAAITRIPADILGVSGQVGTIAAGKQADLVILSGEPFEFTTRILAVYSGGKLVHPKKDD